MIPPMSEHIYKKIELTGSSTTGIQDAIEKAIARAAETIRNMRWFEVTETRGHIVGDKVAHWQVTLKIGFTLDDGEG
jgi:flavin-binding protein dodecin